MKIVRLLSLGLVVAVLGCGKESYGGTGPSGTPGANEVWMQNIAFNPSPRAVTLGTTITWTNKDGFAHTVTSSSVPGGVAAISSGNIAGSGTFQVTFSTVGTYQYFCTIHGTAASGMRGTITVN